MRRNWIAVLHAERLALQELDGILKQIDGD